MNPLLESTNKNWVEPDLGLTGFTIPMFAAVELRQSLFILIIDRPRNQNPNSLKKNFSDAISCGPTKEVRVVWRKNISKVVAFIHYVTE